MLLNVNVLRHLNRHVSEFVQDLQEVVIIDYIIKASSEQTHEMHQFTRLNLLNILKDDVYEVVLLDDASVVRVKMSELGV